MSDYRFRKVTATAKSISVRALQLHYDALCVNTVRPRADTISILINSSYFDNWLIVSHISSKNTKHCHVPASQISELAAFICNI